MEKQNGKTPKAKQTAKDTILHLAPRHLLGFARGWRCNSAVVEVFFKVREYLHISLSIPTYPRGKKDIRFVGIVV